MTRSIKTTKAEKNGRQKQDEGKKQKGNKDQGQEIENSNKYGRYSSNHINSNSEYKWSKCTN